MRRARTDKPEPARRGSAKPVGWHREHGDFTPIGQMEQRQKFVQSLRYMRENELRVPRPPAGLIGAVVVLVVAIGVIGLVLALLL